MKKILFITSVIGSYWLSSAQQKLSINDIYQGRFYSISFDKSALVSLKNGKDFVSFDTQPNGKTSLKSYDYPTGKPQQIFIENSDIEEFAFNSTETKLLLGNNITSVYRHSKEGIYWVYDLQTKQSVSIFDKKIKEPLFSPDGNKVAFVFENNIYVRDLQTQKLTQITTDGKFNKIINGISDWVYEEEFSIVRMFDWSADSQWIGFIRFDESEVPEFSMDIYGKKLYPTQSVFKYPKAGEKLSKVSIWAYHLETSQKIEVPSQSEYLPRLKWVKNGNILSFIELNRHQDDLKLVYFDVNSQTKKIVYSETNSHYIEVPKIEILDDNSFLITSEKDGFNHIYHYKNNGKLKTQLTKGQWEVTELYGINQQTKTIFYQSTEKGSIQRNLFSIDLNGKNKILLTPKMGINDAFFSADFSYFIATHQSSTEPYTASVFKTQELKKLKTIIDNSQLIQTVNQFSTARKEFQEINIEGNSLNMWILKPSDFNPSKKYPVLMYQYSGPGSQSVRNRWFSHDDYWYLSLTQKGYIVVCVDGRGTGYKGAAFKKSTYLNLGKYETIDQIKTAQYLATLPFVDKNRIGIWGWSFGGFIASNAILKGNDIFKTAIAVAPVTSWELYNAVYTERYMRTPQENPTGYQENSPLYFTEQLKGKYLLVHGTADDNVHVQNTMRMIEELVQKNKSFDWAIYPDKNHGIYGGKTRQHLFEKLTEFIETNL